MRRAHHGEQSGAEMAQSTGRRAAVAVVSGIGFLRTASESEMGAGKCGSVMGAAKEGVGEQARLSHDANMGAGLSSSCCKRGQRLGRALQGGPA